MSSLEISQLRTFDIHTLGVGNIFILAVWMIPISLFCFAFNFIYSFLAAVGLPCCTRAFSSYSSQHVGFSLWWRLWLQSTGSRVFGLSSCDARTWLLPGIRNPPGPGIEPVCPALAKRFLNSGPPGRSDLTLMFMPLINMFIMRLTLGQFIFLKESFRLAPYFPVFLGFLMNLLTPVDTRLLPTLDSTFHSDTRAIATACSF